MSGSYDALTALGTVGGAAATFLAVLVALFFGIYPIYKERKEKRERARNLRARLLVTIGGIIRASNPLGSPSAHEEGKKYGAEFNVLFPHTILLTPQEQDKVGNLYSLLAPGWPVVTAGGLRKTIWEAAHTARKSLQIPHPRRASRAYLEDAEAKETDVLSSRDLARIQDASVPMPSKS